MSCIKQIPCQTDAGPNLGKIVRGVLGNGRNAGPVSKRPYAGVNHFSRNVSLRLGIPSAIPAKSIRKREPGSDSPFVLYVQADSGLVIWLQGVGLERSLSIQAETLEIKVGDIGRLTHRTSGRVKVAEIREIVTSGSPPGENVLAVGEGIDVPAKLHVVFGEGIGIVVLHLQFAVVVIRRQIEALS